MKNLNTMLRDELVSLLRESGQAHHQAFLVSNGADDEWPLWYAEYLHEKLNRLLASKMTKSELVYALVHLNREYKQTAPALDWPDYYAKHFLEHYTL
jgi:NAD(P)H-hydrate epimerase